MVGSTYGVKIMKVCVLASGSKGNVTYVETNQHKLLLDIGTNVKYIKEKLLEINSNEYKNWNGTTTPTLNAIKKYRQYSEFKTSTFIAKDSEYEDGQIKNMYFEFSK